VLDVNKIKLRFSILNLIGTICIAEESLKHRSTCRRMQGNAVPLAAFEERRKTNANGRTCPYSGDGGQLNMCDINTKIQKRAAHGSKQH
jgi:hypothetical protein